MDDFLRFALPHIGEEETTEVLDTLRSGWLTTGPKTRRFEEEFSRFIGEDVEAIAVNSGTSGLHLALEAVGVGAGDHVITTPFTFTATAEVIRYLGADPVFVDIELATMNIDPSKIEKVVTSRTKAILVVHFGGLPCNMGPILEIARKHGLKIIEDAAHALPAAYDGRVVGSLNSDATVFSFYATKPVTTGEGGMLVTRHPEIARRCRIMRLHGISRDAFDRYTSTMPDWHYEVIAPGFKYNMGDLAASIGIHQLRKAERFRLRREEIAKKYTAAFQGLPIYLPPHSREGNIHSWHLYVIRLRLDQLTINRDRFIELMTDCGIGTSVHFIPLHLHPYWKEKYGFRPEDFPVSLETFRCCVSLPIYTLMTDSDVTRVIKAVRGIISEHSK